MSLDRERRTEKECFQPASQGVAGDSAGVRRLWPGTCLRPIHSANLDTLLVLSGLQLCLLKKIFQGGIDVLSARAPYLTSESQSPWAGP